MFSPLLPIYGYTAMMCRARVAQTPSWNQSSHGWKSSHAWKPSVDVKNGWKISQLPVIFPLTPGRGFTMFDGTRGYTRARLSGVVTKYLPVSGYGMVKSGAWHVCQQWLRSTLLFIADWFGVIKFIGDCHNA